MTRPRPFVVTGAAHSGTRWLATVLCRLGVPCTHEAAFPHSLAQPTTGLWCAGEVSWAAVPHVGRFGADGEDVPVFRLVRNPLHVVRSIMASPFLSTDRPRKGDYAGPIAATEYVKRYRPDIVAEQDRLTRVVRYVCEWDTPVAGAPALMLENGPHAVRHLLHWLTGRAPDLAASAIPDVCDDVGTTLNAHGGERIALHWRDMPSELFDRAEALGYDV